MCAVAATAGPVGKMRTQHAALALVFAGGSLEPPPRQTDAEAGRPRSRKSPLVAGDSSQTDGVAQLQCSWFSPRMNRAKPNEINLQLNRSGLAAVKEKSAEPRRDTNSTN